MPRKTIALIVSLFVITLVLLITALQSKQSDTKKGPVTPTQVAQPSTPLSNAKTILSLSPNPISLGSNNTGTADVQINTNENEITAVQIEVQYDPKLLTNVKVVTGDFFTQPVPLINTADTKSGRVTYALGISPSQKPLQGTGTVARITFTKVSGAKGEAELTLLPTSLVTSSGIDTSVLKSATGTKVILDAQ